MINRRSLAAILLVGCLLMSPIYSLPTAVIAATINDLTKQKQALAAQAEQARKDAEAKAAQAAIARQQIDNLNHQIDQTQQSIESTSRSISQTEKNIENLNSQIVEAQGNLAHEKAKGDQLISSWYMEGESRLLTSLLEADTISEVVTNQQYYESVNQQIVTTVEAIAAKKADLERQQKEKENWLRSLQGLRDDQQSQQQSLESTKQAKDRFVNDATNAVADLNSQAAAAQEKIKEIDAKIAALTATRSWGTQIVSSNEPSWYYMQTGNYTHLGNSPYTVSQYGCLITSMAMVATYYGHHVTPSDIASNTSLFNSGGYLLVSSPPGIGVTIEPSQRINWDIVDDELANGHPVIVSIYLPSVGSINADGSSHFVVIKGRSGDKYLMHDPIGDGRGYDRSQVRSMKIIRPL